VIGLVQRRDPGHRLGDGDAAFVNFLCFPHDAGNRAEPAGDAQGSRIGESRQAPLEHQRIEFERFAIDVEKGARKIRAHQGRPYLNARRE
jgi:hypothetical protein